MVGSVGGWSAAAVASRELLCAVSRASREGGMVADAVGARACVVAAVLVPRLLVGGGAELP